MTLQQLRNVYTSRLTTLYPPEEVLSIFNIVCEDLLQMSKRDIMLDDDQPLAHLQEELLLRSLENLLTGKPVQYITGFAHFYGHLFEVNEHTLIPRQETEELVHWILTDFKNQPIPHLLDIGTGTGCIGISLGHAFAKANSTTAALQVSLMDVSLNALQVAQRNAAKIAPSVNFNFIKQDILQARSLANYDVIVSNPPYVRELEKLEIHKNVLDFEPSTALFVSNEDPLLFYRQILQLARLQTRPLVYFEINQYMSKGMQQLAAQMGFESTLKKDLNNNYRMMKCWIAQNPQ